jgi:hypothetical protein
VTTAHALKDSIGVRINPVGGTYENVGSIDIYGKARRHRVDSRDKPGHDEVGRRRILPRMRQLHHGEKRHLPEVRNLRRHDGVQLKALVR